MSKRAIAVMGLDHFSGKRWTGAKGIGCLGWSAELILQKSCASSSEESFTFKAIQVFGLGSSSREKKESTSSSFES